MPAQPVDATPSAINLFSKGGVYDAPETGRAFWLISSCESTLDEFTMKMVTTAMPTATKRTVPLFFVLGLSHSLIGEITSLRSWPAPLRGHFKTGHTGSLQNRPTEGSRNLDVVLCCPLFGQV